MNKYLRRGLALIILGVCCVLYSLRLMEGENNWYKLLMSVGVIFFGLGFVMLMYFLIREIDLSGILKRRKNKK